MKVAGRGIAYGLQELSNVLNKEYTPPQDFKVPMHYIPNFTDHTRDEVRYFGQVDIDTNDEYDDSYTQLLLPICWRLESTKRLTIARDSDSLAIAELERVCFDMKQRKEYKHEKTILVSKIVEEFDPTLYVDNGELDRATDRLSNETIDHIRSRYRHDIGARVVEEQARQFKEQFGFTPGRFILHDYKVGNFRTQRL